MSARGAVAGWPLALRLARRDLRGGLRGFYVLLACLVLGVATIAGVQSLSQGMLQSLQHDSRYILGGDLSLRRVYQPATPAQLQDLQKGGPVSAVTEMRAMARSADDAKASMTELKAVDLFYPLYGAVTLTDAENHTVTTRVQDILLPDAQGVFGAVAEPDLLAQLGVKIGDTVKVGQASFVLRAIIAHEPDRLSGGRFTLAPRLMIGQEGFTATGLAAAGNQLDYSYRLLRPQLQTRAALLESEKALQDKMGAGWRARSFYDAAPGLKRSIDQLTLFLTLIGLATLLIGGVGMANAVKGWVEQKLASLATLKSLGATRRLVLRLCLTQVLVVATLGILLGLALGGGIAFACIGVLAGKLSLSAQAGLYPQALLTAAAFGYLTVLTFTLWPLGRAAETAPRELFRARVGLPPGRPRLDILLLTLIFAQMLALLAVMTASDRSLALWFAAGTLASFAVFRLFAVALQAGLRRLRPQGRPALRLAIANLARPGNATAAIILSLGLGLSVLSAIALVQDNLSRLLRDDLAQDAPSFFFLDVEPQQKDAFVKTIEAVPGAAHVLLTPSYRGRIVAVNGTDAEKALIDRREEWVIRADRGFTYTDQLPAHSRITQGQWWPAGTNTRLAGAEPMVSISTDVQRAFGIGVGDRLTVNIMGVEITARVANVREVSWTSFTMNFAVTFAPGPLDLAPANMLATAVVPQEREAALQAEIARDMPNVTSVRVRDALATAARLLSGVLLAVRLTGAVTLLAGMLVLAGAMAAARQRQLQDAVVLKVLGATRAHLRRVFLIEYACLGLATAAIAGAIGTVAGFGIIHGIMDLPWHFSPWPVLQMAALCLALAGLAGAGAARRALGQKAAPFLRNL